MTTTRMPDTDPLSRASGVERKRKPWRTILLGGTAIGAVTVAGVVGYNFLGNNSDDQDTREPGIEAEQKPGQPTEDDAQAGTGTESSVDEDTTDATRDDGTDPTTSDPGADELSADELREAFTIRAEDYATAEEVIEAYYRNVAKLWNSASTEETANNFDYSVTNEEYGQRTVADEFGAYLDAAVAADWQANPRLVELLEAYRDVLAHAAVANAIDRIGGVNEEESFSYELQILEIEVLESSDTNIVALVKSRGLASRGNEVVDYNQTVELTRDETNTWVLSDIRT